MKICIKRLLSATILIVTVGSLIGTGSVFAEQSPQLVDVIESIQITELYDVDEVIAEWVKFDSEITVYDKLKSAQYVKFIINWSDDSGKIKLNTGDYFKIVIPDVFDHNFITIRNGNITNENGAVVATYYIDVNSEEKKEITITFTDYVENHSDIKGDYWCALFTGEVESEETKILTFEINGDVQVSGEITIEPKPEQRPDVSSLGRFAKWSFIDPENIIDDYYYFTWNLVFNLDFETVEKAFFEDIIPENSPHMFITESKAQELGRPDLSKITISEYIGADEVPKEKRYETFYYQYFNVDDVHWMDLMKEYELVNGAANPGIDNGEGINVSEFNFNDKKLSASLGKITRPTIITYHTISTIKLDQSALEDPNTLKQIENRFYPTETEEIIKPLDIYYSIEGGSATGVKGSHDFAIKKADENGNALMGAVFALYIDENCTGSIYKISTSENDGNVTFHDVGANTYYVKEVHAPEGYLLSETIYKVVVGDDVTQIFDISGGTDAKIIDGKIANYKLSDQNSEFKPLPSTAPTEEIPEEAPNAPPVERPNEGETTIVPPVEELPEEETPVVPPTEGLPGGGMPIAPPVEEKPEEKVPIIHSVEENSQEEVSVTPSAEGLPKEEVPGTPPVEKVTEEEIPEAPTIPSNPKTGIDLIAQIGSNNYDIYDIAIDMNENNNTHVQDQINPDFVGYLTIPGIELDLPLVKSEDNSYYLTHSFNRTSSPAGAAFMDYRNTGFLKPDQNTILYGHNMKDGSIFSKITHYRNRDVFDKAHLIITDTPYGRLEWQVFAAYVSDVAFAYNSPSFGGNDKFADFLEEVKNRSFFDAGINVSTSDKILTLSTCAYDFSNARFVVHARLIN